MKKFYVVWKGRTPGVYDNWDACKKEVEGFQGALYKGFPDKASADAAFLNGYEKPPLTAHIPPSSFPPTPFIAVDAACSGNPGKMEYRGVWVGGEPNTTTVVEFFKSPVFENGTNNIGEFLAIVHALAWLKQKRIQDPFPVYSDSVNAQKWVREKQCKTKLQPNAKNQTLFELIARAEYWLRENDQWLKDHASCFPVLKWKTETWGEIPADFGRK